MPKISWPPEQLPLSTSCNWDHWCVWQVHCPILSGLTKKLVDASGDPRERQWLHQCLSLAMVRGNAASILACVQVWSYVTCSFSSCIWCTDLHHCPPLPPISMCSSCLPNPRSFCKIHCSLSCAVLPCALVKYLVSRIAYDESTAWCHVPHYLKSLRSEEKIYRRDKEKAYAKLCLQVLTVRNHTWNRLLIKNLLIDFLFIPIVESTYSTLSNHPSFVWVA